MPNFDRNNLDKSSSPYLRQHKDNPIHWQEWSEEVLEYAKKNNKLVIVSIGYATCHWCHVMAKEVFSDQAAADMLNKDFVSIKVDREQRPDIDRYFMSFISQTQGQGGWPLNVVLTPDGKPFFAGTYIPLEPKHGLRGFVDVMGEVAAFYQANREKIEDFHIEETDQNVELEQDKLLEYLKGTFDSGFGGFGGAPKFPPYNTLLMLMSLYEESKDESLEKIITLTLDIMATRGLHDHLQGGFYRYAVDGEWTVPHFEKMLYDQAMHLWVYSWAHRVFNNDRYKSVVKLIIKCLDETFFDGAVLFAAHDADTEHVEGQTYVWELDEIKNALTEKEFGEFSRIYEISAEGNFEGKNHLVKKQFESTPDIDNKLLLIRKKRAQPFVDKKIVSSWNALAGVGLVMAYRYGGVREAKKKAEDLFSTLMEKHFIDGRLYRSSLDGEVQKQEFLEDYASVLLLASYLFEERSIEKETSEILLNNLQEFNKKGTWYANKVSDFRLVPAEKFDQPIPSAASLAEYAKWRSSLLLGKKIDAGLDEYGMPLSQDFLNMATYLNRGNIHEIHSPDLLDWQKLPINCIQVQGKQYQDCYSHVCHKFENEEDLLKSLNK